MQLGLDSFAVAYPSSAGGFGPAERLGQLL